MWKYQSTDDLFHYGVIGMKWGKRKASGFSKKQSVAITVASSMLGGPIGQAAVSSIMTSMAKKKGD